MRNELRKEELIFVGVSGDVGVVRVEQSQKA